MAQFFFVLYLRISEKKMKFDCCCFVFGGQAALFVAGRQWIAPMRGDRRAEKRDQN
jgi:hypothetical protein